ncbi:MAG TPA: alkaline phosphatase family protein [Candidatus Dormibacteraeota bacterium]|nr:alkaline phosphatase family protein [Candidatus Dormibacteraeota bacterium]
MYRSRLHIRSAARFRLLALVFCALALVGCVGGQVATTPPPPGQSVRFGHVFIVVEENHNYADVVASPSMAYLNSLANQYGLAANYFANAHPSIPNYFELTTGQTLTLIDALTPHSFPVSENNVIRELFAAGKTWKSYAEDLPAVGYTGGDSGNYAVRHNPLAYMTDVQNDPVQTKNLVPFTQFAADLSMANLPDYSFIVPNLCNDAHDCSLTTADNWLKTNLDALIRSPVFQKDGLLIIVFDEANLLDFTAGGGHVAAVIVSPLGKRGYKSIAFYQHQSVLRLALEGLGVTKLPGEAARAPAMWEFFSTP